MNDNLKSGTKLNILSLEDSVKDFELICEQLSVAGFNFNITRVDREDDFKSSLLNNKYDLILADFKLPGYDAFNALRLSSEICPNVPVICVSGSIGEEIAIELIKQGAVDYVLKDKPKRLPFAIKRALDEAKEKETRVRAEEALLKSEELFKNLFKYHAAIKLLIDPHTGNIIDANEAAVNYYGWPYERITSMKIQDINTLPPDEVKNAMKIVLAQKKINFEFRHRRADGSIRDVEVLTSNIRVRRKDLLHSIIHDITERKTAEEKVNKLNRLYAVLSEINKAIVRTDDEQKLFESACRIAVDTGGFKFCRIGITKNGFDRLTTIAQCSISKDKNDIVSAYELKTCRLAETAFRENKYSVCNNIGTEGKDIPCENKALELGYNSAAAFPFRKSGSVYGIIIFYSSKSDFFDEDEIKLLEELSSDISYCIDIIERDKQKQKIEEERDRLFNYSIDMMCIIRFNGYLVQINPAWEKTLGWSNDELMAKPFIKIVYPEDRESTFEIGKRLMTDEHLISNYLNRIMCKDGTYKWLSWNMVTLPEVNQIFAVARDITALTQNESERKKLEAQLIQAQKLESLGTMASGIAHDFNNILNIIMGYASLIKQSDINDSELLKSAENILDAGWRGADLVKQLLTFARKSESVFQSVQVNNIITEISRLLKETFPKTIEIKCELQEELPLITGDSTQIHQIFLNLCVNARDAMPLGGTITIRTKRVNNGTVRVKNPIAETGDYVEIQVADTGTGIDETVKQKIFDPFFTTKEKGKGTGLGLALVFGIIKNHGGFIELTSEIGQGTTFFIYLPAQLKTPEIQQIVTKTGADIPRGTETILLIEDEKQDNELLTTILVLKGYKVITAFDGLQGITAYRNYIGNINVVISDIGLPRMDGEEVYKQIKAMNPNARIIMISGYINPDLKARLYEAGARYFIQKPFTPERILKTVREIIEEKI
ncbi:MAG: PAS domain S-box protein [Spirochaetota bacterium]